MRFSTIALALTLLSHSASAQDAGAGEATAGEPTPEALEEARELFSDGVRYAESGEFERAVIAFRRAKEIKPAPAIRFNLASALYETRALAEAATEASAVAEDEEAPAELRQRARELLQTIRRQSATLTIHLGGQADGAIVDGEALTADQLDRALILEPGNHTIVGLRRGEEMTHREIEIPAGGQAHVDVSVVPSPEETARTVVPPDEPTEPTTPLVKDWRLWAAVGAGVVVIAAVVVIVVVAGGGTEDPVEGNFNPGVLEF